jgi:uncharacterized small protein (DUF1192 family)
MIQSDRSYFKSEWARLKNEGKQKLPSTSAANA